LVMENIPETEIIEIPKDALSLPGDNGLYSDEKWLRDDLVKFMLITSSNDAARSLAAHVGAVMPNDEENPREAVDNFVFHMNKRLKGFGLEKTYFVNETGLDVSLEENGGYGTAREIAKLFAYGVDTYPGIFGSTSFGSQNFKSLSELDHVALNTNQSVGEVAGISASKTGFTNISGGNLVVSFDTQNEPIVLVVLGSTFTDRFTDVTKLSNATIEAIKIFES
jgi:D-alanyl-D-alanine carboxypeptidase